MNKFYPKTGWQKAFSKPFYTDEEIVEEFISATDRWYTESHNQLFGLRDEVRNDLVKCLKEGFPKEELTFKNFTEGQIPEDKSELSVFIKKQRLNNALEYARMKFLREWTGWEGMFVTEDKVLVIVTEIAQKHGVSFEFEPQVKDMLLEAFQAGRGDLR